MPGSSKKAILENIEELLKISAKKSNRSRNDVKLIAVSKLQSVDSIRELLSLGVKSFGENYLQESQVKQEALANEKMEWHFIGQIQSKKAKDIVGQFAYIHSVDRMKVAEKINSAAVEKALVQKILVEVNLAGEESKGGIGPSEVAKFLADLRSLKNIQVCGLMVMPPLTEDAEAVRPYFAQARELLNKLREQVLVDKADKELFKELSMGTSHDFHVAIEEGATMVRLGTVLFGPRPVQKDLQ